ncbi:hypothetical protein CEXT_152171 [Caerostris extrusa]|uniref:Uncharacterized protein n=1 Tax=Caerostris extrusa TaxID=172846 RepID=A0AAV4MP84_CAEEX|nr:hypothetical protein CEXT_152171 [Caerostris extrusa]
MKEFKIISVEKIFNGHLTLQQHFTVCGHREANVKQMTVHLMRTVRTQVLTQEDILVSQIEARLNSSP